MGLLLLFFFASLRLCVINSFFSGSLLDPPFFFAFLSFPPRTKCQVNSGGHPASPLPVMPAPHQVRGGNDRRGVARPWGRQGV